MARRRRSWGRSFRDGGIEDELEMIKEANVVKLRHLALIGWFAIQALVVVAWGNGLAIPEVTSYGHPDLRASFPEFASYESPNHKWRITCRSRRDAGGWPEHSLAVSLAKEFIGKPLYVTGRWCEVLWNDRNDLIALTDWEGSNLAEVTIIDLNQPEMKRPLAEIVPGASQCLSKDELDGHIYWEAVNWEWSGKPKRAITTRPI